MEFFDASAPATGPAPGALPETLRIGDATSQLLDYLDKVDDLVDPILDHEQREPLEPEIAALLEEVTGAEGAPAHFARINQRVRERRTTWDRFWQRPQDEYRGFEVIQAAINATSVQSRELLAANASREESR